MPDIAILFWFYKEVDICENRLQLLKKNNPDAKIYGLFGGPHHEEALFKDNLRPYLDDFYMSPYPNNEWKWIHGDLVLLEWYQSRGKTLQWESIAIVQWDLLIFNSIQSIIPDIKEGEIFLSGLCDLTKEIENKWWHTSADEKIQENYQVFIKYVKNEYNYERVPPLCCQFIFEVFPRGFFNRYQTVKNKELGMLEYKIPTYADLFRIPFYKKDLGVVWEELGDDLQQAPMNASPRGELNESYIHNELAKPNGWKMFHPYSKKWLK